MRVLRRQRLRWNRDLLVVADLGPLLPGADPTEARATLQIASTQVVRHRRRWRPVR